MAETRSIVDPAGLRPTAMAQEPSRPRLGRLVLTPNLRVRAEPETAGSARPVPVLLRGPLACETAPDVDPGAARKRTAAVADLAEANRREAASLERRIAELEAAMAGAEADWEDPETDDVWLDAGWARPGPVPGVAGQSEGALADAAAVRALVAEVVRQELRGALGEGISRNLRKMVRREIARALAERDLD
ncbi:hypothetical protein BV509_07420 [Rhodovulum sulfidophilum]|uniref:Uncharacterized protein n=1 Tax=Rhodovulum visakhapatnamense TaxID=364297 RepID=A0ABS1RG71_9RHOB|nr:hypothetical protein [Rhodovulum visakhapatnamense]MBL3571771.1 hypothetical protein [Rhodovulum visakhapatnamense]MBL3578524.1 hypothetical protein [Rhodovulum visakhapatnamense]OLS44178.1 hypothetical protein BV509_07420 [Rhodovulum sulfidophilum]